MNIDPTKITIRELAEGYVDNSIEGVRAYGGRLDVRPPYQREFVYDDDKRNKVIDTVIKGFPLNVMYWAVRDDGSYEIIDGQQRTISICLYFNNGFSINKMSFDSYQPDAQKRLLDYVLTVYKCEGTDTERLDWFETINIAGATLTPQELRNAVYHGPWLADAKRYFSRPGCMAQARGSRYLAGRLNRQEYLETAIHWMTGSKDKDGAVRDYMARHKNDPVSVELQSHFQSVVTWVEATFPEYRKEMKGQDWGRLHRDHGAEVRDPAAIEAEIKTLFMDDDVTSKKGIYEYVLDRDPRHLSIRAFTPAMRRAAYERQGNICAKCGDRFEIGQMDADHVKPWSKGGPTTAENCQMLCKPCNRRKGAK